MKNIKNPFRRRFHFSFVDSVLNLNKEVCYLNLKKVKINTKYRPIVTTPNMKKRFTHIFFHITLLCNTLKKIHEGILYANSWGKNKL